MRVIVMHNATHINITDSIMNCIITIVHITNHDTTTLVVVQPFDHNMYRLDIIRSVCNNYLNITYS